MYSRVFMFVDIHASKVANYMNENDFVVRFVFDCGLYVSKISCGWQPGQAGRQGVEISLASQDSLCASLNIKG